MRSSSAEPRRKTPSGQSPDDPPQQRRRSFLRSLFFFATRFDAFLIVAGCAFMVGFGALQVLALVTFADFFDLNSTTNYYDLGIMLLVNMTYWGLGIGGCQGIAALLLDYSKNRQITRWKKEYLKSILRQDVGWYDVNQPQELSTRMGESIVYIEKALHLSNANIFTTIGSITVGLYISLRESWAVALVTLAVAIVAYLPSVSLLLYYLEQRTKLLADAYAGAGGVASEVLSSIRTVASLGLEERSLQRYDANLANAERAAIRLSTKIFAALSTMNASIYYVMASGILLACQLLVSEYRDTTVDYTDLLGDARNYCAESCDSYDLFLVDTTQPDQADGVGAACADRTSATTGEALENFKFTCSTAAQVIGERAFTRFFGDDTLFWNQFENNDPADSSYDELFPPNSYNRSVTPPPLPPPSPPPSPPAPAPPPQERRVRAGARRHLHRHAGRLPGRLWPLAAGGASAGADQGRHGVPQRARGGGARADDRRLLGGGPHGRAQGRHRGEGRHLRLPHRAPPPHLQRILAEHPGRHLVRAGWPVGCG